MSLKIPVLYTSDAFSFYRVVSFLICLTFYHRTNHIRLVMILTMMGLTMDPLVPTLFVLFICVLTIPLVVLVVWCLAFLYQQELSPNVIVLRLICSYQ